MTALRNVKLTLQYKGTAYCGWQVQPTGPTIQAHLQETLFKILREKVVVIGAGRTDSGVHALAQAAHFRTQHPMELSQLKRALNSQLPEDISILDCEHVEPDFHAQKNAVAKTYSYIIWNSEEKSPFFSDFTWQRWGYLDFEEMEFCLEHIQGEHNFKSFCAADSDAKTFTRTIERATLRRLTFSESLRNFSGFFGIPEIFQSQKFTDSFHPEDDLSKILILTFRGPGFLKHMIRNLVGTLLDVGKGKLQFEDFCRILEAKDRRQAGMTAPAKGLFLVRVDY